MLADGYGRMLLQFDRMPYYGKPCRAGASLNGEGEIDVADDAESDRLDYESGDDLTWHTKQKESIHETDN